MSDQAQDFQARLLRKPVIAGLRNKEDALIAKDYAIEVCFYLTGTIFELRDIVSHTKRNKQLLFVHVDLIQGVARDACGIKVLVDEVGIDGILTTRTQLVREAKACGLLAIQRLFILDSEALKTGLRMLQSSHPDAVEILPALILPNICKRLPPKLPPIIGGGLVETSQELAAVLESSAMAVSTSKTQLWGYQRR